MRDYNFITDSGGCIPVGQLSTPEIQELIREGVRVVDADGYTDPEAALLERLHLELFIRSLGLTSARTSR